MAVPNPSKGPQLQRDRGVYFLPGQLVFLIEHENGLTPEELCERLLNTRLVLGRVELLSGVFDPERVVTLTHRPMWDDKRSGDKEQREGVVLPRNQAGQAFALDGQRRATREAFSLVFGELPSRSRSRKRFIRLIDELNEEIAALRLKPDNELVLRGVSPNWLLNGVGNHTGGSGPGGRPSKANPISSSAEYTIRLEQLPDLERYKGKHPVEVAILDTAPPPRSLIAAYSKWAQNHDLLRGLLGRSGYGSDRALEVYYAAELGFSLPSQRDIRVKGHEYEQYDHGLFAAGIIHSIAPRASLRLLQVLNDYGVGTIEGIVRALLWLRDDRAERAKEGPVPPLLINCSLMAVTPLPGHSTADLAPDWPLFRSPVRLKQQGFAMLALSLEWACAALRTPSTLIVAAAGNDGDEGGVKGSPGPRRRPPARYPAAFETVLGVGALNEGSVSPTSYTNKADRPDGSGIATFGGEKQASGASAEARGILGLYIGQLPEPGMVNDTGWATWSGSSFAAPIVTGALAALAQLEGSLARAEERLEGSVSSDTGDGVGWRLPAKQG